MSDVYGVCMSTDFCLNSKRKILRFVLENFPKGYNQIIIHASILHTTRTYVHTHIYPCKKTKKQNGKKSSKSCKIIKENVKRMKEKQKRIRFK